MNKKLYIKVAILLILVPRASFALTEYIESNEDFNNPDRGFYFPYTAHTSAYVPLNKSDLENRRNMYYQHGEASYSVRSSIALRHYVLDTFANEDQLSVDFLNKVQADFDTARQAGVRLIVRFSYTVTPIMGSCAAVRPCPPYGDTSKISVLRHIQQIKPVLQQNSDTLLGVQMGFIGIWGENYYTDHFGDPSINGQGYLSDQNWHDRRDVLAAMLDAVPSNRMVQARLPQAKQRFLGGPNAPVSTPALSAEAAFKTSDEARIGFHNDCLLASSDDFGTYADYGNTSQPFAIGNSAALKTYAQNDSRFTLVGGETCSDAYNPTNDCESQVGGTAVTELERYHYTFLNSTYNVDVNNDWEQGECMDEIKRRLGYRFVLKTADVPASVAHQQVLRVQLEVINRGFASAINPREVYFILRDQNTGTEYRLLVGGDNISPQVWHAGTTTQINATAIVGETIPEGNYQLLLHIADPSNNRRIFFRPEYSIRLANQDIWESGTGYNNLGVNIQVSKKQQQDFDILDFLPAVINKRN